MKDMHAMAHKDHKHEGSEYLEALKEKHAKLEIKILHEQKRPSASDMLIRKLKSQKLKLKDKIEKELHTHC